MKKYVVEFFGTCMLTLAVMATLAGFLAIPTALIAGYTLGLLVYTVGHISGVHINPAVTAGLWSIGKIKSVEAGKYIFAQFLGAGLAILILKVLGLSLPVLTVQDSLQVFLAEAIGTLFFAFGIAAVVMGKVHELLSGLVIGGSLIVGAVMASLVSNGILNPAVAWGLNSFSIMYLLAPVVGSVAGMKLFVWLNGRQ